MILIQNRGLYLQAEMRRDMFLSALNYTAGILCSTVRIPLRTHKQCAPFAVRKRLSASNGSACCVNAVRIALAPPCAVSAAESNSCSASCVHVKLAPQAAALFARSLSCICAICSKARQSIFRWWLLTSIKSNRASRNTFCPSILKSWALSTRLLKRILTVS